MRRIVDGLRYDTETAEKLAEDRRGRPGDARHVKEVLYRASSRWLEKRDETEARDRCFEVRPA